MSGLTLYQLSEHLVALLDSYDLCESDEQRAECNAEIQRVVEAQIAKVDSFCKFLSHLESQMELAEKEIKRLKSREAVFANLQERLKAYAVYTMQKNGLRTLEGDTAKLALRTNQPAVEIDNEEAVPAPYKTIKMTPVFDKVAIKSAIKSGKEVPGAHLREPSVSLIRT